MCPVTADAAAVYGDARYTCESIEPILPGKFLFVVEITTSSACVLPNVSTGPPRQAAHEGGPILHPAFWNISRQVSPSIFIFSNASFTFTVEGTINVSIATFLPYKILAAATKSVVFPPVHDPIYALSNFTSDRFLASSEFPGLNGFATIGSSSDAS